MANVTVNELNNGTFITTIDPVNDALAIYNHAAQQTYPINRNTLLGVSGTPADLSTAQTFINKSISGSSNTLTNIPLATAVTGVLPVANGGTGSSTQNFVDLTTAQTIAGNKTFSGSTATQSLASTTHTASGLITANGGINTTGFTVSTIPIWQYLGSVNITSNQSTTSTSPVQVTGLSITVTIPVGYTKVRIKTWGRDLYNPNTAIFEWQIWRGVVNSGTQLGAGHYGGGSYAASLGFAPYAESLDSPGSGSVTYNVGWFTDTGTLNIEAGPTCPASLSVEVC